jgi:FKBP-type peptidyl-prolyl cis-trans isomerase 2
MRIIDRPVPKGPRVTPHRLERSIPLVRRLTGGRASAARQALLTLSLAGVFSAGCAQRELPEVIEDGKTVAFEYSLSLDDGTLIESNVGADEPVKYVHGGGQILPALEAALIGMAEDERKTVKLEPEDAYGVVDPRAYQEIPRDSIPEELLEVGTPLQARGHDGPIRVHEIHDDRVVLDFNHPLAGEALNFDIRIVSIE